MASFNQFDRDLLRHICVIERRNRVALNREVNEANSAHNDERREH